MKILILTIFFLIGTNTNSICQSWTNITNYPGIILPTNEERIKSIVWQTSNAIYIGGGEDLYSNPTFKNDFYKYNPSTNTWLQLANLPITTFTNIIVDGFVINDTLYFIKSPGITSQPSWGFEIFRFNNNLNNWTLIATWTSPWTYPAISLNGSHTFSYNGIGYIAFPYINTFATNWSYFPYLIKFNPINQSFDEDTMSNTTGSYNGGAFLVGNYFYMLKNNLFKGYDLIQKTTSNFPLPPFNSDQALSVSFSDNTNGKGYFGYGGAPTYFQELWEYDQSTANWTQLPNPNQSERRGGIGFSFSNCIYLGLGYTPNGSLSSIWQYCSSNIINEFDKTNISIYPNPITDALNITIENNISAEIILFDIQSRIIFEKSFIGSVTFDTKLFLRGMYFYIIKNKEGIIKTGKITKQ